MKVIQINATCRLGSTGNICYEISRVLTEERMENLVFYSSGHTNYEKGHKYMSDFETKCGALSSRILGNWGFNTYFATKRLVSRLKSESPSVVHLHNIHGHNCHLGVLLTYLKESRTKVIWTFHDCWAFTGYCMHYDMIGCEKWKYCCKECPQYRDYSWFFDNSRRLFVKKKELLKGLALTIVVPSKWMSDQVSKSFLREYPVKVINNGIDLSIYNFKSESFKTKIGIPDNFKLILGVAFGWNQKKGLDVFLRLSEMLPNNYKIVLVGTDEETEKQIPERIISIHRTKNQTELAEIYSSADVFVNPTREENYPTVNMEALACGTPVITFNTGGSAEIIDSSCGVAVEKNDIESMKRAIIRVCEGKAFTKEACLKRAESFDMHKRFQEYIDLYNEVAHDRTSKG